MIKPLSLLRKPATNDPKEWISPLRQRADSLVFSVTSSKQLSPKDSLLILSDHGHALSRELQTLQLKLENLQSRVERIDSENYATHQNDVSHHSHLFLNTEKIHSHTLQENKDLNSTTAVGRIVAKTNRNLKLNKLTTNKAGNISKVYNMDTQKRSDITTEESMIVEKAKEISKLKSRIRNMKVSVEKSQKSASLCSERLSASKKELKVMKREDNKKQKLILKLRENLRRSQGIRQKQKEVIMKQQQEIKQLRLQLNTYRSK